MHSEIAQAITKLVKELFDADIEVELTRPDEQFGDYSTNVALQLAQKLNRKPREIAEAITTQILNFQGGTLEKYITKTEVAGPGFINITLNDATLRLPSSQYAK